MKAIYNSTTGRVSRPRVRHLGEYPKELLRELAAINKNELTRMKISADMRRLSN